MSLESYKLLGEVARGGMGVVLRATGPDGRDCAIKVLKRPKDLATLQRFERERRLLSVLGEDEGFVPVLEAGESSRGPYIVMPYLPGGSLRERLAEKGKLSSATTVRLGAALAHAAGQAHKKGIVHRDLKPENILFTRTGRPLLADLGLAKHFRHDVPGASHSLHLTGERTITGTVGYMAPEQMRDSAGAGPRCDVFAIGAILYECLVGKPAFAAQNFVELLTAVQDGRFEPIARARPDCPKALEKIVVRALSKAPEARYADGAALAAALEAVPLDRTALLTPEPGSVPNVAAPSPVPSPPPRPVAPPRPTGTPDTVVQLPSQGSAPATRRPRWLAPVVIVASVATGAGAVALLFSVRSHDALVARTREGTLFLEQQARFGGPQPALESAYASLHAQAPGETLAELDVAWARILWRRGRTLAARDLALPHVTLPGPAGLDARRIVADALLAARENAKAEEILAALESGADPTAADWARLRRGLARVAEPRALAEIAARVEAGTDEASLWLLAEVHALGGRADQARPLLARVISLAPDHAYARLLRARLARGRLDLVRLRGESDREPHDDVEAFFHLAGAEAERSRQGVFERARSELATRRYEDALRDIDAALDAGLNTVDVDAARSWFGGARGKECAARVRALDVKEAIPAPETTSRLDMAATVTPEMRARLVKRAARAEAPAREALEQALLSAARGEAFEGGLAAFDRARKLAPRCPVVATERARFLVTRCRPVEALAQLDAARDLPGTDPNELELLKLVLCDLRGRTGDARATATHLASAGKGTVWGNMASVWLAFVARVDDRAFDVKAWHVVADTAKAAVALAPESALAHAYLAQILETDVGVAAADVEAREALNLEGFVEPGAYQQALNIESYAVDLLGTSQAAPPAERTSAVDRAINDYTERFPSPLTLSMRANKRLWEDGLDLARDDFERVILLDPGSPLGEGGLGTCAIQKQRPAAEVRIHWAKAKAIDPSWTIQGGDIDWARSISPDLVEEFGPKPDPDEPPKRVPPKKP